jgi:hypothetical protein
MAAEVQLRKNKRISLRRSSRSACNSPPLWVMVNAVEVFFRIITRQTTHRGSVGFVGGLVIPIERSVVGWNDPVPLRHGDPITDDDVRRTATEYANRQPAIGPVEPSAEPREEAPLGRHAADAEDALWTAL